MSCNGCGDDKVSLIDAANAIAIGMYKVAKAILRVDPAPREVVAERRAICRTCEYAVPCKLKPGKVCWCGPIWDGVMGKRETCGCNIEYKTMVAGESCPLGKWQANNK